MDINTSSLVHQLKKAIRDEKAPEFNGFSPDKLRLWKVNVCDNDGESTSLFPQQEHEELQATKKIENYFPEEPAEEQIHIIVTTPSNKLNQEGMALYK